MADRRTTVPSTARPRRAAAIVIAAALAACALPATVPAQGSGGQGSGSQESGSQESGNQGSGNICEDQIRDFVARNFNQTVDRVQFRYQTNLQAGGGQMVLSQGLAFPRECPGYHFFDVLGDDFICARQSRRGHVPTLVTYRSSGDGC